MAPLPGRPMSADQTEGKATKMDVRTVRSGSVIMVPRSSVDKPVPALEASGSQNQISSTAWGANSLLESGGGLLLTGGRTRVSSRDNVPSDRTIPGALVPPWLVSHATAEPWATIWQGPAALGPKIGALPLESPLVVFARPSSMPEAWPPLRCGALAISRCAS